MAKNDLKLLGGWFSPFALRVQIALNLKGVDYEVIEETLNPKSELLLKSNPVHKKIPVLLHQDKVICESAIIVEYIDEVWTHAPSILPQNAYDRANARFWVAYIDDKWFSALKSILNAEENDEAKEAQFEQAEEVFERMEEVMNKGSEGKAFFGGDTIGFIDIGFGSFLSWIRVVEKMNARKLIDEIKHPGLFQWTENFAAHPAVNGLIPDTDKLIEVAKAFKQILRARAAAN
ncbi:glutathione S-transferase U17 [Vigna radiata var. radiata]|uniref:Glutathione S-transferase n=1 Tax=Vigna radiata var. radiata TaxID=3916 RepID=A0A1S3VPP4_VIGRR|nr:glutathione S-transferase U17 [Vigna radiata var. radiata]